MTVGINIKRNAYKATFLKLLSLDILGQFGSMKPKTTPLSLMYSRFQKNPAARYSDEEANIFANQVIG